MSATGLPADWEARSVQAAQGSLALEVWQRGEFDGRVQVRLCGRHHAANLLAAYAVLRVTGLTPGEAAGSLSRFQGLSRRLERWPEWRGVTRLDDYAHHPTAVRAVLEAVRHDFISSSQNGWWRFFSPIRSSGPNASGASLPPLSGRPTWRSWFPSTQPANRPGKQGSSGPGRLSRRLQKLFGRQWLRLLTMRD